MPMADIKLSSFTKEATVLKVVIDNKNIAPALVGLFVGVIVYTMLIKQ